MAENKAVSIKFPESGPIMLDQQTVMAETVRLKPGMSQAVKAANDDLYEAEKQMKDLEKKRIERMKDLETFDCAEMLKTAGVKIKVMNQLLDRLIPSDDSHTVIVENKTYSIEVIPGNLMTFRVPVKNACPPMRFNISYNDSESKREGAKSSARRTGPVNKVLKVFVDQEEKEPKENRC